MGEKIVPCVKKDREITRKELNKATDEFLKGGGVVQLLPSLEKKAAMKVRPWYIQNESPYEEFPDVVGFNLTGAL